MDLQWWGAAHPLVTKARAPHNCVRWWFSESIAFPRQICGLLQHSSVCAAKPHGPGNEAFLGRKTPGCSTRSPEGCCAPCICFSWLSWCNAARNRSCSTCRDNVVDRFHLTRTELCKFKVFITLSQTWFLLIIFCKYLSIIILHMHKPKILSHRQMEQMKEKLLQMQTKFSNWRLWF